jgi:peptidoglycan/xylan/chitin deacetylase (PgdA/CDA1 family)
MPTPASSPVATQTASPTPRPTPIHTPTPQPVTPIEWSTLPTSEKVVALTIDCGGNAAGVPKILAALEGSGVPATFFLTGRWVEAFPNEAKRIAARYPLGNHTYRHPHMTALSSEEVRDEVIHADRVIREVTGVSTRRLFRFPYGERDDRTRRIVAELGYTSVFWTVDTLGWKGRTEGRTAASVADRVLDVLRPGMIVLMHAGAAEDGSTLDADALPDVVRQIRAKGYRIVPADAYLSAG